MAPGKGEQGGGVVGAGLGAWSGESGLEDGRPGLGAGGVAWGGGRVSRLGARSGAGLGVVPEPGGCWAGGRAAPRGALSRAGLQP